eukprot:symbB.v1.2.035177.t2/scaffold4679.1/size42772/5
MKMANVFANPILVGMTTEGDIHVPTRRSFPFSRCAITRSTGACTECVNVAFRWRRIKHFLYLTMTSLALILMKQILKMILRNSDRSAIAVWITASPCIHSTATPAVPSKSKQQTLKINRDQDKAIDIPEKISFGDVWTALNQITWPNCFTRNNVRPDGAPFIEAFPLGVVLNYALGLVCSRPTRLWPNLTKLLAKFIAEEQPDFRYTTVQLNKNYATKMHVDGNNHGPSYIIGLGDYTGGEVWILDEENGTVEVELPCTMRGWPHLRPGTKVKGRLEDCSRISIVFFTRRGWLTMLPETKESLEDSGFLLPGEEFLDLSTVKQEVKSEEPEAKDAKEVKRVVPRAPKMQEVKEEPISEDEVDEDEEVDQEMRAEQDAATWPSHDWGARLRTHLKNFTGFEELNLNVALLGSANVFGIALQELLSPNSFRITTCTEAGSVAMRLLKRTCKPQHAFLNLDTALAGHGHCDIHHKVCTVTSRSESEKTQDLLFGSFACEPFLNQDPSRPSCFDDPRSGVFRSLRKQVATQKPHAALLLVECWQKIPEVSQPSVRHFLMDGKDPRMESEEAFWGLRHLDDYAATFLEVPLEACGVPLAGAEAIILLVRQDCGGVSAAEAASQLVRTILNSNLLPRCSLHALMFSGDDPRVVQAQKEAREAAQKGKSRRCPLRVEFPMAIFPWQILADRKPPNAASRRKVTSEIRELGLQPGEAPYTEHLRRQRLEASRLGQSQIPSDQWLRGAPDEKAVQVNLVFARAGQHGLDIENLCADLSQLSQGFTRGQRDDGLLPRSTAIKVDMDNMSEFYSFNRNQHRTLVGQELLLCFGYPIWRLDFRGISDAEATQLTARSPAIPAVGICMAAMLAVVQLPGLKILPEKDIAHLLSKEKPEVANETQVTSCPHSVANFSEAKVLSGWAMQAMQTMQLVVVVAAAAAVAVAVAVAVGVAVAVTVGVGIGEYRSTGVQEYRVQEYRSTGVQEYRSTGVQEYRSTGVQEYRSTGVQEYRSTGVQEYRSTGV